MSFDWRTGTVARDASRPAAARDATSVDVHVAWLGMGSNVGDRRAQLAAALRAVARFAIIDAVSPVYASAPVGYRDQPEFWNLVTRVRTKLAPDALLRAVKEVEAALGRTPTFRNGPREIDIDVLLYDSVLHEAFPTVPHPRMHERAFVLRPLLDLDPALSDPRDGARWAHRLEEVAGQRVERVLDAAQLQEENGNDDAAV